MLWLPVCWQHLVMGHSDNMGAAVAPYKRQFCFSESAKVGMLAAACACSRCLLV